MRKAPPNGGAFARVSSVEAVAAGAGARGVGVVDREALLLDGVDEVDHRAVEVGHAHPVDHDGHAVEVGDDVTVEGALVEEELVAQAAAATRLHGDAQREVVAALLLEEALHLAGRDRAQVDLVLAPVGDHRGGNRRRRTARRGGTLSSTALGTVAVAVSAASARVAHALSRSVSKSQLIRVDQAFDSPNGRTSTVIP